MASSTGKQKVRLVAGAGFLTIIVLASDVHASNTNSWLTSDPRSVWETEAMREVATIRDSTQNAPDNLLTKAERTNYQETGSYDDCVAFYAELAKSPLGKLERIGVTAEGRPLYVFIASKDKAFSAQEAALTGKPIVLLQNGIHPGENGGKDASMMLLRDVLITKTLSYLLDEVVILSIPVFNADGHEATSIYNRISQNGPSLNGRRGTAQRYDLNRDYLKADAEEMRAWLRLYNAWRPHVLIDNHSTDGRDTQYDVMFFTHVSRDADEGIASWSSAFLDSLIGALAENGHTAGWYIGGDTTGDVIKTGYYGPRYSTGYATARNRAALLVESHSLKRYRTRVWSHYDTMREAIRIVAEARRELSDAVQQADAEAAIAVEGTEVVLHGVPGDEGREYLFQELSRTADISEISGGEISRYLPEPDVREVTLVTEVEAATSVSLPAGYIVPASLPEIVQLLELHGLEVETLEKPVSGVFEGYRFRNVAFSNRPIEGRFRPTFQTEVIRQELNIPAGSIYVPADQADARLVAHLLEPLSQDSLVRWGFMNSIFQPREYFSSFVFEPIAARAFADDPDLKTRFEEELAAGSIDDNAFSRLYWVFSQSPYRDTSANIYPIVRVYEKTW